eukprot:50802_1
MSFIISVIIQIICTSGSANPNLIWMSNYDFDPPQQHGWSYGSTGSLYAIKQAYTNYQMQSMIHLPTVDGNITLCKTESNRYPIFYWDFSQNWNTQANICPDWSSNLKSFTSIIQPFIDNKTIVGYFIGDELTCHGVSYTNFEAISDQIRNTVSNKVFIYANECASTFEKGNSFTWTKMPESINWISADYYDMNNGTQEYIQNKQLYETGIFPLLKQNTKYGYSQGTILVPGIFACNASTVELQLNSQQIVIALNDMYQWAQIETRIFGFNPWHFDNRTNKNLGFPDGCTKSSDDLNTGAIVMPNVVAKLKEIGYNILSKSNENNKIKLLNIDMNYSRSAIESVEN